MRKNSRKKNMSTAKLGVIFIVAAMALAGIGAGYAAWFDTITVEGTVGTGSVGWHFTDVSGTEVFKILNYEDDECLKYYWKSPETRNSVIADVQTQYGNDYVMEVAYADVILTDDHHAVVTYNNLFPCVEFEADVTILYTGTIPGKINDIVFTNAWPEEGDEVLIDKYTTLSIEVTDTAGNVDVIDDLAKLAGYQLHEGYTIHVIMAIHLPQIDENGLPTDYLMGLTGDFGIEVTVVQWNEYPYEGGGCGEEPPIGHHADVMLCLDRSGSISGYESYLQTAAKAFVTALLAPDDGQVGIVSFATTATLDTTFSTDITYLHGIIDGLVFTGSTNLEQGIQLSQNELATADRTPDSDPDPTVTVYPDYMVIITDGAPTAGGDPTDDATAAKAAGTRIFVLGIGLTNPTTVALMTAIASPGDYYDVADWTLLEALLLSLV